jgi:ectoine hydroxylase-related dioxygenase (phytanoyl-CoA dioxygenase family)
MTESTNNNTTTTTATTSLLTEEHIAHFKEHGYCVVHDVASASEVAALRRHLHRQVRATAGVDYERMDNSTARKLRESGSFSQGWINVSVPLVFSLFSASFKVI